MTRPPKIDEQIPESEVDRLMGTDHWCEREGECRVQRVSEMAAVTKYACSVCLTLWSCRLTALGPAWWKAGTVAPSTEVPQ
jgi:hypothetical protein